MAIAGATTDCSTNVSFHEAADCGRGKSFAPVFGGAMIAAGLVLLGITAWGNPPPEPE